jgi:RecA-family ATPase
MNNNINLIDVLNYIDPANLSYQEWIEVGMSLKHEGYDCNVWKEWSARDSARFHANECEKKWATFHGSANPVTAGTVIDLAMSFGWSPKKFKDGGRALDWDDEIGGDDYVIIGEGWVEENEFAEPENWNPAAELIKYLETLFEASENVGYVTQSWQKDDRYLPTKGNWDRTAGELIQELNNCKGDTGAVIGDYNEDAGAWIRFNPLDGKGVKNENVTDYRYALVESDTLSVEKQTAIIRELELPAAALVYSGGKSVHAVVKVDAKDYAEYRKRVDYLYEICKRNGLVVDVQNKNPSRLSRMPGIMRNGHKQFLIDTNIGKSSWKEWEEWIEELNDNLPDFINLSDIWNNMPKLDSILIDGVLRCGHKLLLAGPSKAGKSYLLIELAIAIAHGGKWISRQCTKGRVLYVNLELADASCLNRFPDISGALGISEKFAENIDIWNLRGNAVPMDKLAPKLIRRAQKRGYTAIIIDPLYKIITGDENSADQMARFFNLFDKVALELKAAVIYCHHHSKGAQVSKRSIDRSSGSGVFGRDPDAILDLTELNLTEDIIEQQKNKAVCDIVSKWLDDWSNKPWRDIVSQDDALVGKRFLEEAKNLLTTDSYKAMLELVSETEEKEERISAWRVECTLREFATPDPVNIWFRHPVHIVDTSDILNDATDIETWQKKEERDRLKKGREESDKRKRDEKKEQLREALKQIKKDSRVASLSTVCEYLTDITERDDEFPKTTLFSWLKKWPDDFYKDKDGMIHEKEGVPF